MCSLLYLLLYWNPFNFSDPNSLVAWNGWQNSIVWSWSSWSTVFAKHRCYLWIQGRFIYGPFCLTSKDLWCLWALNTEYPNRVHFTGISRSWPFAFQRRATSSWVVDQESSKCLSRKGQLTFFSFKTPPLPTSYCVADAVMFKLDLVFLTSPHATYYLRLLMYIIVSTNEFVVICTWR